MDLSDCTPGLRIEVTEGPYAGWTGTVRERWLGMGVIVASVDDWPRADRITFDPVDVEPLDELDLPDPDPPRYVSCTGSRPETEAALLADWTAGARAGGAA